MREKSGQKNAQLWLSWANLRSKEEGCEPLVCNAPLCLSTLFFEAFLETPELHLDKKSRSFIQSD
jgi:hypothetical protein